MSNSKRLISVLVLLGISFSAGIAVAQDLYWCPICGGNTHHYDGHPHFQQQSSRPQPPPSNTFGVVTIYNRSNSSISYYLQDRVNGGWKPVTVAAGGSYFHWRSLPANFTIQFYSGNQKKSYHLDYNVVRNRTPVAADGKPYHYNSSGQSIKLSTSAGKETTRPNVKYPTYPPKLNRQAQQQIEQWRLESQRKRERAEELARAADRLANVRKYDEAIKAYQESLAVTYINDVQRRLEDARSKLAEQNRQEREEAARADRDKVSDLLDGLADQFSDNSNDGGGLDFDGTSAGVGMGELDFASGTNTTVGQSRFDKGNNNSAPVPLDISEFNFQSKKGADAIALANRLDMQRIARRDPGDGPPEENSDRALPNPLDEDRIARQNKLLEPLDMVKFGSLSQTEAAELASARVLASRDKAILHTRADLEEAWNKLRHEGNLGDDEDPWKKSQTDKAFKATFDAILKEVAAKENQRMRQAEKEWYHDMTRWVIWQLKKPEIEPQIEEMTTKLNTQLETAIDVHHNRYVFSCYSIEMRLRNAGILKEGESPMDKADRDPAFAARWKAETQEAYQRLKKYLVQIEEDHRKRWSREIEQIQSAAGIPE